MRFQVLRHALAPAFVWVLVAFACGTTIGQLALQRVQVIEAEHPVVVDANGAVVGALMRDVPTRAGGALPSLPNVALRLADHPILGLHIERLAITGTSKQVYFTGEDCSGAAYIDAYDAQSESVLLTPTFKLEDQDVVFFGDIGAAPEQVSVRSSQDDSQCGGWWVPQTITGLAASAVVLPHFEPPFTAVMRSDLQPAP